MEWKRKIAEGAIDETRDGRPRLTWNYLRYRYGAKISAAAFFIVVFAGAYFFFLAWQVSLPAPEFLP